LPIGSQQINQSTIGNWKSAMLEKLILASRSPRRAELLRAVGWPFEIAPADIDESVQNGEDAITYVRRLALTKAQTVVRKIPDGLVLGADTTVVIEGEILGQPIDDDDARRMLNLLNGKWHEVITGVALLRTGNSKPAVGHEITRVRFAEMSAAEIDWYISTGETRGKAGAYGIQGQAGLFVKEIAGDYFNIVGLPVRLVFELSDKL
jgi:septum formation protein